MFEQMAKNSLISASVNYADSSQKTEQLSALPHRKTVKATTTNQAYLSRLPKARALEALIDFYDPSDPEYPDTEKRFEAFADDLESAYNTGELSAVEYNSLADIAFFEIPTGYMEVDDDADDYSNIDYIGHGLEEPRPQYHGGGMIARELSICHR